MALCLRHFNWLETKGANTETRAVVISTGSQSAVVLKSRFELVIHLAVLPTGFRWCTNDTTKKGEQYSGIHTIFCVTCEIRAVTLPSQAIAREFGSLRMPFMGLVRLALGAAAAY